METVDRNRQIGQYLQIGGVVLGAIAMVLLITRHPVLMGLNLLGAGLYFVGQFLRKI